MPKNVFIDLGSFNGDIIRKFISSPLYSSDFEIHAFEANPLFSDVNFSNYPAGVKIHKKAAWYKDGQINIFVNKNKKLSVQGTSVFGNKITGDLDPQNPIAVDCIDFSEWLENNFSPDDNIIVKSNIEGAEYPLFHYLIDTGVISYIKRLFLRLHWHKIGMSQQENEIFLKRLSSISGLALQFDYKFEGAV